MKCINSWQFNGISFVLAGGHEVFIHDSRDVYISRILDSDLVLSVPGFSSRVFPRC